MNSLLRHAAFVAGLLTLVWVGVGYVGDHALALGVTGLIGAVYLAGAAELQRFQRATTALAQAVGRLTDAPAELPAWLAQLPAALRGTVRRRIEGEPVGFAGPGLAPYLAGLLVLLGMLGTFVGMVLTLRGTGSALDAAADLQAVRASLVAPVQGLGLAFGTSIAGVATSAALGLMSALARGDRARAAQALDARIATTLPGASPARHREATLLLLQRQAEAMPALVDSLRDLMQAMERQGRTSSAQLLASQDAFHARAEAAYGGLAASVDRSLRESLGEGARIAGDTIRPVVEATLAGIARETAALHATLADTAHAQADRLSARFESVGDRVAASWADALTAHERASHRLQAHVQAALDGSAAAFEQRAAGLLTTVGQRHADWQQELATRLAELAQRAAASQAAIGASVTAQLDGVSSRLDGTVDRIGAAWREALAEHARVDGVTSTRTEHALGAAAAAFETHSAGLLRSVGAAHADLQATAGERDARSAAAMAIALDGLATSLRDEWQAAGAQAHERQQQATDALTRTARALVDQVETHTRGTLAEIGRLVDAAADAPRAAAEVIAELRGKLADSIARDNALLDERGRLLQTLATLLEGVDRAALQQRGAIDALVASSAQMLDRVGERFGAQVDADAARLASAAAQVGGSAAEVAGLGEAFGGAVQQFDESNRALVGQLQRIEGALDKSLARSDEQLAYYVAQAREVVDLSILSQRQIIEELQGLSSGRSSQDRPPVGRTSGAAA